MVNGRYCHSCAGDKDEFSGAVDFLSPTGRKMRAMTRVAILADKQIPARKMINLLLRL